jgi:hypothetical protein
MGASSPSYDREQPYVSAGDAGCLPSAWIVVVGVGAHQITSHKAHTHTHS